MAAGLLQFPALGIFSVFPIKSLSQTYLTVPSGSGVEQSPGSPNVV